MRETARIDHASSFGITSPESSVTPYTCHLIACCKNLVLVYKWGGHRQLPPKYATGESRDIVVVLAPCTRIHVVRSCILTGRYKAAHVC